MPTFDVYTYQFSPTSDCFQQNLFDSNGGRQKVMDGKNSIFEGIFRNSSFYYRGSHLLNRELFFQDNLYVFKLAPRKLIKLEQNFSTRIETNEPSVCVIIYNDDKVQRIAIETLRNRYVG